MDIEDMEVIMVAGMDANAVKPKLTASHIIFLDTTHTSVDITIWANDLLKPKLTHGVDMDMEDIMVKFVYHGSDIYEMITTSSWIYSQTIDSFWHPIYFNFYLFIIFFKFKIKSMMLHILSTDQKTGIKRKKMNLF